MPLLALRRSGRVASALVASLLVGACASSTATPAGTTPTPLATPVATPSPVVIYVTPTPTPTPVETPTPGETPAPGDTPAPEPTVTATAAPSASPAASPTSPAALCTGNTDNKSFFAAVAHTLSFDIYCAVLPSGWWLQSASYKGTGGGSLYATYKSSGGGVLNLYEDHNTDTCFVAPLGNGKFGNLAGKLYQKDATPTYGVVAYGAGTVCYRATATGLTQARFTTYAAALTVVPKS